MDIHRFFRHVKFSTGEITRVRQILRPNGTSMLLPYDQFIEHDCRHLEGKSDSGNPYYICELGKDAGFNGIVFHYGLAMRYWPKLEGEVPIIVKINGKTSIPSEENALSTHTSFVEDSVRIGATAIGYTMYYGTPAQDRDLPQLAAVRRDCERYGIPLIIWAYPRGSAIDAKGGKTSSYALESAARLAAEMGATIIKSNLPADTPDIIKNSKVPEYFRKVEEDILAEPSSRTRKEIRARRVVQAAQGIPVLFSGGDSKSDEDVIVNAEVCVEAGCFGFIIGRNMWKREKSEAIKISQTLSVILDKA